MTQMTPPTEQVCKLCELCERDAHAHNKIWYAFASRLEVKDALQVASKLGVDVDADQVWAHLWAHVYEQPSPAGKFKPQRATQESVATFPLHYYWILRTLYRCKTL